MVEGRAGAFRHTRSRDLSPFPVIGCVTLPVALLLRSSSHGTISSGSWTFACKLWSGMTASQPAVSRVQHMSSLHRVENVCVLPSPILWIGLNGL